MRYITYLFFILFLSSCTKDNSPGKDFLDREFFFNDLIYRVDTKKSSWIEANKYYQCPTIGTPVVFYVEFTEKPVPGRYKVVSNSESDNDLSFKERVHLSITDSIDVEVCYFGTLNSIIKPKENNRVIFECINRFNQA